MSAKRKSGMVLTHEDGITKSCETCRNYTDPVYKGLCVACDNKMRSWLAKPVVVESVKKAIKSKSSGGGLDYSGTGGYGAASFYSGRGEASVYIRW